MEKHYDVIIVGAGPAGLSAAIYLTRAKYSVLIVEKGRTGGQVAITSEVVNYPGVLTASGQELTDVMHRQAVMFGTEFLTAEVTDLELDQPVKRVKTSRGEYTALGLIAAMGANPRKIGFSGEEEYKGRGITYCATCDGEFFTGMDVFVIGGGFSAAEEAVFLTRFAKKVHIIMRKGDFSCSEAIAKPARENPKIEISYHTEVVRVEGDTALRRAVFRDNRTDETWEYNAKPGEKFGMFIFAGYLPATSLLKGKVKLNEDGYVVTDDHQKTGIDGVYAAGDLCVKPLRQVVTAVSDGAVAATSLEKYIFQMHEKGYEKGQAPNAAAETDPKPIVHVQEKAAEPAAPKPAAKQAAMIPENVMEKIRNAFSSLQRRVVLEGLLDDSPLSRKVETFLSEIAQVHENVTARLSNEPACPAGQWYPAIRILSNDGEFLRVQFHGVPGGHELDSFLETVKAAGGAGEDQGETLLKAKQLGEKLNLKILVTLSCTMCPDLVMAAQRVALENPLVEAEVFDVLHYPALMEKYHVMSVPCLVINDEQAYFGRKNMEQLVSLLQTAEVSA
jgi:thioredoxin reductase (NADPH)